MMQKYLKKSIKLTTILFFFHHVSKPRTAQSASWNKIEREENIKQLSEENQAYYDIKLILILSIKETSFCRYKYRNWFS